MISVGCIKKVIVNERLKKVRVSCGYMGRECSRQRKKPVQKPGILRQGGETEDRCGLSIVIERVKADFREVVRLRVPAEGRVALPPAGDGESLPTFEQQWDSICLRIFFFF